MPNGVRGQVSIRDLGVLDIEVLEVRDSSITLMTERGVGIANYRDINWLTLTQNGTWRGFGGMFRREIRPLSRFPAGITPEVMARLLESAGQSEPIVLRR